jgi:hypothetical protein
LNKKLDDFIQDTKIGKTRKNQSVFAPYFDEICKLKANNISLDKILIYLKEQYGNDNIKRTADKLIGDSRITINNVSKTSLHNFIKRNQELVDKEISKIKGTTVSSSSSTKEDNTSSKPISQKSDIETKTENSVSKDTLKKDNNYLQNFMDSDEFQELSDLK